MEGSERQLDTSVIELTLHDMANGGDAVGRHNGRAVFVKGGIAGEVVRTSIIEQRRDFLRAEVIEVLQASPDRVPVAYPSLIDTGGLQWQHIAYSAQLEWKTKIVRQLLQRIGKFQRPPVQMMLGVPAEADPWRQRTVAQFAVGRDGAIGFRRVASHEVLDMPACPIVHPSLDAAYQQVRRWLLGRWRDHAGDFIERFTLRIAANPVMQGIPHSPVNSGIGSRTQRKTPVLLSIEAHPGGGIAADGGPETLGAALMEAIPALVGVVIVGLSGHRGRVVTGQDYLIEQVLDKKFRISAGSFFQVNDSQTPILVRKALAFAQPHAGETVLDGYSGVGLFSVFLASEAASVTAIESQPSAVSDARTTAALNRIENLHIIEGLLERVISQLVHSHQRFDVAIVDPPRTGCHPRALQAIKQIMPRSLVYISCDPATLARDLQHFCTNGYRLTMVQPIDMFPNTSHIETVSLVERWS
jgi:23S rRNA (uracil1939-C5)-methyltransferase